MPRPGRYSQHFTEREFDCRDGCGYGAAHPDLIVALETLRKMIGGKPLHIVSGLRCPPRNRAVDGAARSRHQSGEAADIKPGLVTVPQARRAGFKGIGHRGRWVTHVDTRRSQTVVVWEYP